MITEKAIEKHKYFTTGNGDMWIVGSIETVKVVQLHRIDQYGQGGVTDVADITLGSGRCKEFNPVTLPTRPAARPLYAVEDSKTEPVGPVNPVEKQKNSSSWAKKTKGRPSRTGYVGVQIRSTKRKGDRYYATVTESGKTKRIGEGSSGSAELAAAVIADYKGEPEEAARLRKLHKEKTAGQKGITSADDAAEIAARVLTREGAEHPPVAVPLGKAQGGDRRQLVSESPAECWRDGEVTPPGNLPESMAEKARRHGYAAHSNDTAIV